MKLRLATEVEINRIWKTLEDAKKRPNSGNFLDGFPRHSTTWYSTGLENNHVGNIFLFWDGSAWGEDPIVRPRRLSAGVTDFITLDKLGKQVHTPHLHDIKQIRAKMQSREFLTEDDFLILAGQDTDSPLLVLDGNHRIAAAFWRTIEDNDWHYIPGSVWFGVSSEMSSYPNYSRLS